MLDVLAATLLLGLFCGLRTWPLAARLVLFAFLAPALIWLSFPGCFLYGGLLVAPLPAVWRERRLASGLAYGLLALAVLGSFCLLLHVIHARRNTSMEGCWVQQFPNWSRPWSVLPWAVFSTFDVVRYCFHPTGHALALVAVVGGVILWRSGQRALVVLLLLPLALALAAALVKAYPYGGARVEVYAAPALALLVAAGVPGTWAWLQARRRYAGLALVALLAWPCAVAAYRVVQPWDRADSAAAADFVIRHRQPEEPVVGNAWQDWYYLRHLEAAFQPLGQAIGQARGHVWLIWTDDTARDDAWVSRELLHGGRVIAHRAFGGGTTVYLTEPAGSEQGASSNAAIDRQPESRIARIWIPVIGILGLGFVCGLLLALSEITTQAGHRPARSGPRRSRP